MLLDIKHILFYKSCGRMTDKFIVVVYFNILLEHIIFMEYNMLRV